MLTFGRHNLLGTQVDLVDEEYALAEIIKYSLSKKPFSVAFLASHGIMEGYMNRQLAAKLNNFSLVLPDGQSVRWALNWIYHTKLSDRVCGPDLSTKLLAECEKQGLRVFFYGSRAETLKKLHRNLQLCYPKLQIAGLRPSLFRTASPEEQRRIQSEILETKPDVVFVGLGCPKQEWWTSMNTNALGLPCLAVGAAFDYFAGNLKRTSLNVQRAGFEWFYRFIQEPRRLFKRYFVYGSFYLFLVVLQKFKIYTRKPQESQSSQSEELKQVA